MHYLILTIGKELNLATKLLVNGKPMSVPVRERLKGKVRAYRECLIAARLTGDEIDAYQWKGIEDKITVI